jgi:predicted RNA-binding Zn-ribbon protein involved in translation (DUF1610 family)
MGLLQNIREVLGVLTRRRPSKIYCPRCGSPKIHLSRNIFFGVVPNKYICENCGYFGQLVMELEKEG